MIVTFICQLLSLAICVFFVVLPVQPHWEYKPWKWWADVAIHTLVFLGLREIVVGSTYWNQIAPSFLAYDTTWLVAYIQFPGYIAGLLFHLSFEHIDIDSNSAQFLKMAA